MTSAERAARTGEIAGVTLQHLTEDAELNEAGVFWPCTHAVAQVLLDEVPDRSLQGKRVLELGAGTGALGIALAALGAHVVITDLAPVLPLIERNVQLNQGLVAAGHGTTTVVAHRWGEDAAPLAPPFDYICACETLYWGGWDLFQDDTREAHRQTLLSCSGAHTKSVVGFTVRDRAREVGFLAEACAADFDCRLSPHMQGDLQSVAEGELVLAVLQRRAL